MTLTLIHLNPAKVRDGALLVDRKFVTGMLSYVDSLDLPIVTVHPELENEEEVMDLVKVPIDELGYEVVIVPTIKNSPTDEARTRIQEVVSRSRLVVGGGLDVIPEAVRQGVPYVMVLEYDLATRTTVATLQVSGIRRLVRRIKLALHHWREYLPEVRKARAVHCNGYPVLDEVTPHNSNCLLYLDSRMSRELMITEEALERRLAARGGSPLRLLYSGRYEPMKGALDAVRTAIACREAGLTIELDCYGQGSQQSAMRSAVDEAGCSESVRVHDSVSFDELATITPTFDAFLCCHVQSDPSCTYLESMGAGLPIVGYGNRMWSRMCSESNAGIVTRMGDVAANVREIGSLISDPDRLATLSRAAISFAVAHSFDAEFKHRTDALRAEYERAPVR